MKKFVFAGLAALGFMLATASLGAQAAPYSFAPACMNSGSNS